MLKDLREASKEFIDVVNISSLEEIKIPSQLRADIESGVLQGKLSIQPFSSYARTSTSNSNYAIFPNQMYKFSVLIYDFAFEVKKYFECIDKYKINSGILELCSTDSEIIKGKLVASGVFNDDFNVEDYELFSRFLQLGESRQKKNDEYRLGGKSIFNSKDGKTTIRTNEDCFGSIILTQLNLPNSSSNIFGDLVYGLTENSALFGKIKNYFDTFPKTNLAVPSTHLLFSHNTIRTFLYGVVQTLQRKSDDKFFFESLVSLSNNEQTFAELNKKKRIYRLFLVSDYVLDEEKLVSGGVFRWFKDPFEYENKQYYLTNQWEDIGGEKLVSRDIQNFIEVFNDLDSKYTISKVEDSYRLVEEKISKLPLCKLPKPFLLLAGISGTGKTRFIREQAKASGDLAESYCLTSVRPDWHEPSDLLGYVSRLSGEAEYVVTDVLQFIVKAWIEIDKSGITLDAYSVVGNLNQQQQVRPFWLCLDEMNLAPVEQYFSDYLSILETREWSWLENDFTYKCDPLLKPSTFKDVNTDKLREQLGLSDYDDLWNHFLKYGISIPFNLMVAGTVNMDETTHGFSRKVIDRALTFDFGEFFPNDFEAFFEAKSTPKLFGYPVWSDGRNKGELSNSCDQDGNQSIAFLTAINRILNNTPFKLAYRALNELLLSVMAAKPQTAKELHAVWDDFLMSKVLPRIEGDIDKLTKGDEDKSIIEQLQDLLSEELADIWDGQLRPDLYRTSLEDDNVIEIECRSKAKLIWMQAQLSNGFTSFWP
jgi:hypothetical protein